ncbi:MAG: MerR family transcriptional regulator, partial [Chitinophagales bacterium]
MASYSIREIEHLSGVKAHTIRIWEQRYNVVKPKRTDTNIRYYTDEDLKLILNVALLNKQGMRIGTIAKMKKPEIIKKIHSLGTLEAKHEVQINELIATMIEIDEAKFEKVMLTNILQYGFEETMLKVVYPFLEKIGIMWMTGNINPAQEHFISNLIRQKIIVAIDGQVHNEKLPSKRYVLFLPAGELHELSLLFL